MTVTDPSHTEWHAWLLDRPPAVRAVAERFPPWRLYRLRTTGQRVHLICFSEHTPPCTLPITVTVRALVRFNPSALFDTDVHGIDPEDLIEIPGSVFGEPPQ